MFACTFIKNKMTMNKCIPSIYDEYFTHITNFSILHWEIITEYGKQEHSLTNTFEHVRGRRRNSHMIIVLDYQGFHNICWFPQTATIIANLRTVKLH